MSKSSGVRVGVFPKILFVMVLISVIPLVLNWYSSNLNNTNMIKQNVDQRLQDTATALGTFVDSWVEMNTRMLKQNSKLPTVRTMDPALHKPILESIVREYDWNYLAFTIDRDGQNISRSDDKGLKDYSNRIYVKQVFAGREIGQQTLIGKTSGKPSLVMSAPIADQQNRTVGVFAIGMTLTSISEKVAQSKIGETGFAFLIDQFGKVIAHPNQEFTNKREDFSDHPAYLKLEPGKTTRVTFTEDGRKVVSIVQPIKQGWTLVVQQDHDEAFADLEGANRQALIFLAGTFVVALLVAFFLSSRLASPIRRLTGVADEISRGNFDTDFKDSTRSDEIGELSRAVERLGNSARLATERFMNQRS